MRIRSACGARVQEQIIRSGRKAPQTALLGEGCQGPRLQRALTGMRAASPEKASFLVFQDMWTRQSNRERGTRQTADNEMRVLHAGFGNDDIMMPKRPTEHRLKMRH